MKPRPLAPVGEAQPGPNRPGQAELAAALHEVSNALTVVLGWLDIASERAEPGATQDAVDVARTYATLGHGLARRAIGAGADATEIEKSASGIARAAVLGVTPSADRKRVALRLETSTGLDDWVADGDAALRVVLNLLLNAVAFSPAGANVTLSLSSTDDGVVFRVSDEGPGIEAERAATLFIAPESTRPGGSGIGLRHSAELARECGAELVLSRPGPGACFELLWPHSETKSGARHPPVPVRLEGARVLVLEDDPAILGLIELALETRGANVVAITTRDELEAFDATTGLSAALFDLSPIADDPTAALETLRARVGSVPLVLISGSPNGVPDVLEREVHAWVRKPFEMGEVIEVLRTLLGPKR